MRNRVKGHSTRKVVNFYVESNNRQKSKLFRLLACREIIQHILLWNTQAGKAPFGRRSFYFQVGWKYLGKCFLSLMMIVNVLMIYCFYKHDHLKFQGLIVMHKESNCLNKYFLIFSFCHLILAEGKYRNLLGTEWKTGLHWDVHELAKNFTRESWSLPSVVRNSTRHVTNLKTPSK